MSNNGKIEKHNLIFQLAKLRRLRGISGKFISASSQYNKSDRYKLFDFIQKSLESFISSELLSSTVHQIASNAFQKINNNIEETIGTLQYLEEWIEKLDPTSLSEADKYFSEVYTYDVYMTSLNYNEFLEKLRKIKKEV
ncbi:hypothetical protein [Lactococcus sp. DD01]|uniref:hypothetical protein n=1 Tax=Lactococcus sp. DD01 TaxID=1776443 RepID=UPI00077666CC|nr:hypothetical protein [Lactococcus sp. DD01]KXT62323.1 hypothetical protein LACDD01_00835 [Lactococcus sp. DD01]